MRPVPAAVPLLFLLLLSSCSLFPEETSTPPPRPPLPDSPSLAGIDSLLMYDRPDAARRLLLEGLDRGEIGFADALVRLLGSYHCRGREDRALQLLDSLESAGWGPLTGWKVSLLDMARRPEEALELAGADRPLLRLWLMRDLPDSLRMEGVMVLPPPKGVVERMVRAEATPPGGLTRRQLEVAAADAAVLPLLRKRVLLELEKLLYSPGDLWERAYAAMDGGGDGARLLLARRLAAMDAGRERLEEVLEAGGEAAAVAAEELLVRWPGIYGESWSLADILCENDRCGLAEGMTGPGSSPEQAAGIRMALLRGAGEHSRLLAMCDSVLSSEASDELTARAMLYRARALRALGRKDDAYSAYTALAEAFPWHSTSREAAYLAGKYFDSEQDWPQAADAYVASLRSDGLWEGDSRAHWRGGFCLYMSGRGAAGDSVWRLGIQRYPRSYWRDEMLFWRARYAARKGRHSQARSLLSQVSAEHPWEFYGMLAGRRLDLAWPQPSSPLETPVAGTPEGALVVEMMESGYGAALPSMLRDGSSGDPMVRARLLSLLGETRAAMTLMRRIDTRLREEGDGMLPDGMLPFYFPDPYGHMAREVAAGLSLTPSILQGIMREESYFDRWVVSWAGARGLIQLMPGTAGDVARWYGLPRLSEEEFYVPENSIRYGALYINRQYESFDGVEPLYLAAYNAGPGNARRWMDMHGWDPGDPELYIEQITYRETRMYVKKVLRSAWIYEGRRP